MSNKKQTAVEWLIEKTLNQDWYTYKSLEYIIQAKEMEKEQIIDAINYGCSDWGSYKDAEQYYIETYEQ
jgi:hypothetical protein